MNYMSEVAKILGVELGERFKISDDHQYNYSCDYYFTNNGVRIDKDGFDHESVGLLSDLICGKYTIKREV